MNISSYIKMETIIPNLCYDIKYHRSVYMRFLRETVNPFEWSVRDFKSNFRFDQNLALQLIDDLTPHFWNLVKDKADGGYTEIPFGVKVLVALNFYATGCYQNNLRESWNLSQSSASRSISMVTSIICNSLGYLIKFPINNESEEAFRDMGFPGVIGCVDGTHVAITNVKKDELYRYMNRKNFASINVQVICDAKNKFININPKFCGANHDSYIWSASSIKKLLTQKYAG